MLKKTDLSTGNGLNVIKGKEMKSTLFLRDLTCLDHATIDQFGTLAGMSYNVDVMITGEVEEKEQVVIDFSKCKHQIKDLIDDFENGFDHKCWVAHHEIKKISETQYVVETPFLKLTGPRHLFRELDPEFTAETYIEQYLESELSAEYPGIRIEVHLRPIGFYRGSDSRFLFRYAHGLKHSTSCGCKRIAHGHLSFVELRTKELANRNIVGGILHDMQSYIRNVYFAHRENVVEASDGRVIVRYTCDAGDDYELILDTDVHNVIILDTETTVENLTAWLVSKYYKELEDAGVTRVYMSEGLMKGAVQNI